MRAAAVLEGDVQHEPCEDGKPGFPHAQLLEAGAPRTDGKVPGLAHDKPGVQAAHCLGNVGRAVHHRRFGAHPAAGIPFALRRLSLVLEHLQGSVLDHGHPMQLLRGLLRQRYTGGARFQDFETVSALMVHHRPDTRGARLDLGVLPHLLRRGAEWRPHHRHPPRGPRAPPAALREVVAPSEVAPFFQQAARDDPVRVRPHAAACRRDPRRHRRRQPLHRLLLVCDRHAGLGGRRRRRRGGQALDC
mmetsp:Transcript_58664/g.164600  ORF Transcript_58664/g.164600 Transcript_58664/m.164600 type:complete len:246 (+) Transcript_58664:515-1252(+)